MEAALRKLGWSFVSALKRTATEHVETREGFGLEKCFGAGPEQQAIDELLVL